MFDCCFLCTFSSVDFSVVKNSLTNCSFCFIFVSIPLCLASKTSGWLLGSFGLDFRIKGMFECQHLNLFCRRFFHGKQALTHSKTLCFFPFFCESITGIQRKLYRLIAALHGLSSFEKVSFKTFFWHFFCVAFDTLLKIEF